MKQVTLLILTFAIYVTCFSQSPIRRQTEQVIPQFTNPTDKIKFYLNEVNYSKRDYDVIYPNIEKLNQLRLLAKENRDLFLKIAKEELQKASTEKVNHLVWVLIQASSKEAKPLNILTQKNLEGSFSKNKLAIIDTLEKNLKFNNSDPQSIFLIEILAKLKYYSAVPIITRMLNEDKNSDLEKTMTVLIDLNAKSEIAEFVQYKIFATLCDKNGYGVVNGVQLYKVLETIQKISNNFKTPYAKHFQHIRKNLIFEPDESTLIKISSEAKTERLRGASILLLAVSKTKTGRMVILNHLKNDPSMLVRAWAAQCFVTHPINDNEVVEALIETYHNDKEHDVRWASIESLGKIGGARAFEILREAQNDKSVMIRELAARMLKRYGY